MMCVGLGRKLQVLVVKLGSKVHSENPSKFTISFNKPALSGKRKEDWGLLELLLRLM